MSITKYVYCAKNYTPQQRVPPHCYLHRHLNPRSPPTSQYSESPSEPCQATGSTFYTALVSDCSSNSSNRGHSIPEPAMTVQAQSLQQSTPLTASQNSTHSEAENEEGCTIQPGDAGCREQETTERTEPTCADQQVCPQLQNTQALNNSSGAPPQASRLLFGQPDSLVEKTGMTASAAAHAEKAKCNVSADSGDIAEQREAPVPSLASGAWTLHVPKTLAA